NEPRRKISFLYSRTLIPQSSIPEKHSSTYKTMVRCCFFDLKSLSIAAALGAIAVKVINPFLNDWIASPVELSKDAHSTPYDPEKSTDIMEYPDMGFVREGRQVELSMGLTFILQQSFPRWFVTLLQRYESRNSNSNERDYEPKNVNILDARQRDYLKFDEAGFTLLEMSDFNFSSVANWRSQQDIKLFQSALETKLRQELFPQASRIVFTYSVVRGGSQFGDQPAAINAPHLDYSQNDTARHEFHQSWPPFDYKYNKEQHILMGTDPRDEDEVLSVLLGIWKPIYINNPVCDHPLAVMDGRTFHRNQEVPHPIHINFGIFTFHNLNGGVKYNESQKWYYYPFQKEEEVLVFTQYTKDDYFCTPHGSFENPNCPEDYDTRVSVEMRAAVFVKKQ
ncbi:hypothetical protein ACHAXS_010721, partial [Conticribra weissflogii]